jgi:pimeloyl-ACP methyl ester carboxylesterase
MTDTVVLLHGLALDHTSWDGVAPRLIEAGYRVLRPDLRAHGEAPVGGGTSWDRLRDRALGVPVLFLMGEHDPASGVTAKELAAEVPSATGVDLADAGHLTIVERPDAVAAELTGFLPRR